jgi:hypothetical protein
VHFSAESGALDRVPPESAACSDCDGTTDGTAAFAATELPVMARHRRPATKIEAKKDDVNADVAAEMTPRVDAHGGRAAEAVAGGGDSGDVGTGIGLDGVEGVDRDDISPPWRATLP